MKKYTYENLRKLEIKIRYSYNHCRNISLWCDSYTGIKLRHTWNNYMIALRGWDDTPNDGRGNLKVTKPVWIAYCKKEDFIIMILVMFVLKIL